MWDGNLIYILIASFFITFFITFLYYFWFIIVYLPLIREFILELFLFHSLTFFFLDVFCVKNYCRLSVVHRLVLDDALCCKVWERMLRLGTEVESDSCLEGYNHSVRQLPIHIRGVSLIFESGHVECQPTVMQPCSARCRSWPYVK